MNAKRSELLRHATDALNRSIGENLIDLEKERQRLVALYDEIMTRVEDGDDTGFTLTRVSQRLSDVNRQIERERSR